MLEIDKLLRFHAEGLKRITSVLETGTDYGLILDKRIAHKNFSEVVKETDVDKRRLLVTGLNNRLLKAIPLRYIDAQFTGFACLGRTSNNIREFNFFEEICQADGIKIKEANYSALPRCQKFRLRKIHQFIADLLTIDVAAFYAKRNAVPIELVVQQVLYTRSFFGFVVALMRRKAAVPRAFVLANDHSPVQVAISMVMKGLGVPRIYLQHAEVTRHFPPLDFEHSVLRNEISRKTYDAIGPHNGKVWIIPREEGGLNTEKLFRERPVPTRVVIYPTTRLELDAFANVVQKLKRNPFVSGIAVKPHPSAAFDAKKITTELGIDHLTEVPDDDHIAIVGSSSVTIELLRSGIPVYQTFAFDPVPPDYYGFLRAGLTKEARVEELDRKFWEPYTADATWLKNAKNWFSVGDSEDTATRKAFSAAMLELLLADRQKNAAGLVTVEQDANSLLKFVAEVRYYTSHAYKKTGNFVSKLSNTVSKPLLGKLIFKSSGPSWRIQLAKFAFDRADDPLHWLVTASDLEILPSSRLVGFMRLLFAERHPAIVKCLSNVSYSRPMNIASSWLLLKKAEINGEKLSEDIKASVCEFVFNIPAGGKAGRSLESMLLSALLNNSSLSDVEEFWKRAKSLQPDNVSTRLKLRMLHLQKQAGESLKDSDFFSARDPLEGLKFRSNSALQGNKDMEWSQEFAEKQFLRIAPPLAAEQFREIVLPVYESLRDKMLLMNVRTSSTEAAHLQGRICTALETGRPFSLVRLSDGEGYLFARNGRFFTQEDCENRERHWWGESIDAATRQLIQSRGLRASSEADIVGIPPTSRFIRDCKSTNEPLSHTVQGRGLLEVLTGIAEILGTGVKLTECHVNVSFFNPAFLRKISSLSQRTILVTSILPEHLPEGLLDGEVEVVTIPTRYVTSTSGLYHKGQKILPYVSDDIMAQIAGLIVPNSLVLMAGGVASKYFIGECKRQGAVALDIGQSIDDIVKKTTASFR